MLGLSGKCCEICQVMAGKTKDSCAFFAFDLMDFKNIMICDGLV
jgi:hypothetical protein